MKKSIMIIIAVAVILIIAGSIYSLSAGNNNSNQNTNEINSASSNPPLNPTLANSEVRTIDIKAERFQYTPDAITIKRGEKVKLVVDNTDTTHGIAIPDLGVSGIDSVEFTADKAGTYQFRCPTMCGSGHRNMTGTIIVTD